MKPIHFLTAKGVLDLAALEPSDFSAEVIADTLAKVNRFNGRTSEPWSVASHSVLVSCLCQPKRRALGLLHDAHEAIIGDLTTPAVQLICSASGETGGRIVANAVAHAKLNLDRQLFAAWGIDWTPEDGAEVRWFDHVAYCAEITVFFGDGSGPEDMSDRFSQDLDRAIGLIRDLPQGPNWRAAKAAFLDHAQNLASIGQLRLPAEPVIPARMSRAV